MVEYHETALTKGKQEQLPCICAKMDSMWSAGHTSSYQGSKCPFETVPTDVLSVLFSFLPSTRELGVLSCVCKRFNKLLKEDKKPWECLCVKWWAQNEFDLQIILEKEVVRECIELDKSKSWRWFCSCLAHEDAHDGLAWVHFYDDCDDEHLEFGERYRHELHGWGISLDLNEHIVRLGRFVHGQLVSGEKLHPGFYKYTGDFLDEEFDGRGTFEHLHSGWTYKGHWKDGQKCGKGLITWPNGFSYDGQWENDQPKDNCSAVHPLIRECLDKGVCTSTLNLHCGQYLVKHSRGYWCQSCSERCF
jgi:hypothetical protein